MRHAHIYAIITRRTRNITQGQPADCRRVHARPRSPVTRAHEENKGFRRLSRRPDLDIVFFRARNRIITRNARLSSSVPLPLEKSDIIVRSLHSRDRARAILPRARFILHDADASNFWHPFFAPLGDSINPIPAQVQPEVRLKSTRNCVDS